MAHKYFTDAAELDTVRVVSIWAWLLRRPFCLLGASVFGDLFLADADGSVKMLDLVACELKEIATCLDEFEWGLGDSDHQEEWLMVGLASAAEQIGIQPGAGQCLAFRTPPILGGKTSPDNLIVLDFYSYHEGLAKLLPQVVNLPLGTEIRI